MNWKKRRYDCDKSSSFPLDFLTPAYYSEDFREGQRIFEILFFILCAVLMIVGLFTNIPALISHQIRQFTTLVWAEEVRMGAFPNGILFLKHNDLQTILDSMDWIFEKFCGYDYSIAMCVFLVFFRGIMRWHSEKRERFANIMDKRMARKVRDGVLPRYDNGFTRNPEDVIRSEEINRHIRQSKNNRKIKSLLPFSRKDGEESNIS